MQCNGNQCLFYAEALNNHHNPEINTGTFSLYTKEIQVLKVQLACASLRSSSGSTAQGPTLGLDWCLCSRSTAFLDLVPSFSSLSFLDAFPSDVTFCSQSHTQPSVRQQWDSSQARSSLALLASVHKHALRIYKSHTWR